MNKQQGLGQGIHASLAGIVAEELDADWDRVQVIFEFIGTPEEKRLHVRLAIDFT